MKINITSYESLLMAAKQQPDPQRLLFVFLTTSLPKDYTEEEKDRFNSSQGGELEAIMCVDKTLDELGSFADLVAESEGMEKSWQIVLVAALSGQNGELPTSQDAEQPLKRMVQSIEAGNDLSMYMAFDRSGDPIQFSS